MSQICQELAWGVHNKAYVGSRIRKMRNFLHLRNCLHWWGGPCIYLSAIYLPISIPKQVFN